MKTLALVLLAALAASLPVPSPALAETGYSGDLSMAACGGAGGPVEMPSTFSKYAASDASRSITDPAAASRRRQQLADLRAYVADLEDLSSRWVSSGGRDLASARCVMLRLGEWAAVDGLLHLSTEDAFLTRDVIVADVAAAYRRVEDAPVGGVDREAIRAWLKRVALDAIAFYEYAAGPRSRANNHRYWAGVAVGEISNLTGDAALRRWAVDTLRLGLCQVRPDGALPLELERGRRALEYHAYALRALTKLDEVLSEATPPDLGDCRSGLDRLRAFTRAWMDGVPPLGSSSQEPLSNTSRRFLATIGPS